MTAKHLNMRKKENTTLNYIRPPKSTSNLLTGKTASLLLAGNEAAVLKESEKEPVDTRPEKASGKGNDLLGECKPAGFCY